MAGNRDVILADFQACTDIDDVGEAMMHLEGTNWDLLAAINNVMPQNSQQLPSEMNRDVEMIEEIKRTPSVAPSMPEVSFIPPLTNAYLDRMDIAAGTSNSRSNSRIALGNNVTGKNRMEMKDSNRTLTFRVHFGSKVYQIDLLETNQVSDLKVAIFYHTNITPCQQQLHGWKKEPKGESTSFKSLDLPRDNDLYMSPVVDTGDNSSSPMNLSDRMTRTYLLTVKDEIKNTTYNLNFLGSYTILDVKSNIYTLIDVPVRNQLWKGWPSTVKDDNVTLAQSGISYPQHYLTVSRVPNTKESKKELVDLIDSDSSEEPEDNDDYEDAPETFQVDDDIFIDNIQTPKSQHLMSKNVDNEIVGTLEFAQEYEKRYGSAHPSFFTGTFEEAVAESCSKPPRERKLLAVYLHHDRSILANVFCTQLLGFETVLQLLAANFIVWGWDCTHESNEQKFLASIQQTLGPVAAMTVRNIEVDTMPVLLIIMRSRSSTEIFTIVHGNVGANDLLSNLIEAVDVFQEQRQSDIEFEDERQARERVKEEQDQAYQESLAADRAKEEAKLLQEKIEKERRQQAESKRLEQEKRKEDHRQAVLANLPPEPPQDLENVIKVKIRVPDGKEALDRRFIPSSTLETLLNFLIVEGYPTDEYKLLLSYPKKDLTAEDPSRTLDDLGFHSQEMLILQER